jgi:hypothetical protein
MYRAPQYTKLETVATRSEIRQIMDEVFEILTKLNAVDEANAKESETIVGQLHTSKVIRKLISTKKNDAETWTIPSILGAVAGIMSEKGLGVLRKIDKKGNEKVKWYIVGNKNNIVDDKIWKEKRLL